MRVLIAPDAFKGTFSAAAVAAAVGDGFADAGWEVDLCPVADGGEGTAAVLLPALGGETRAATVADPLGRAVRASFALVEDGGTALVEVAAAGGLPAVGTPTPQTAWDADTRGVGELLVAARDAGAAVALLCAGGSASTDGGAGALAAVAEAGGLGALRVVVLCDVEVPFEQAPAVFGPQKGADPATVARLERRLDALADGWPRDPRGVPRTGAAGGLSGGLWAGLDAVLEDGAAFVLDTLEVDERLRACDAVVVGEGRLDAGSARGKVVGALVARARRAGVGCHAIVGSTGPGVQDVALDSVTVASTREALADAGRALGTRLRAQART